MTKNIIQDVDVFRAILSYKDAEQNYDRGRISNLSYDEMKELSEMKYNSKVHLDKVLYDKVNLL